jgi:hypothetical protein
MKTRHKKPAKHDGEIAGAADFHGERIRQEVEIEAKHETANHPQGDYEYEQRIAENTVFNPKQMIEEAAFFLAERRNFAPGYELTDWLQAEHDVETQLGCAK